MKVLALMLIFTFNCFYGQIDQYYDYVRPSQKTVSPQLTFDAENAKESLASRSSTKPDHH